MWRQALVENAKVVKLGAESYSARRTTKKSLRQMNFVFDRKDIRGLGAKPGDQVAVGTDWQGRERT